MSTLQQRKDSVPLLSVWLLSAVPTPALHRQLSHLSAKPFLIALLRLASFLDPWLPFGRKGMGCGGQLGGG